MAEMTKTEFYDWIKATYGEKPGNYTDEEVYQIGCKHKSLYLGDRNWKELSKFLGVVDKDGTPKTGEDLRLWIKNKQYLDGTITKNVQLLSGKTINDVTIDEFEANIAEQKRALYIQQTKTRDEHNAYRATLRDEARIQRMKETLANGIVKLSTLPSVTYEGPEYDIPKEAVLLFSDLHIGCNVDNFYNKYNIEIARKRVKKLVKDTINMCKEHEITRLNVLNLGDLFSGIIHVTGRILDEADVITEITTAAEILAEALSELQEAAPEVIYRSCTDNHSRIIADYKQHIEKENLGKIIDWFAEERLKDSAIVFAHDNLEDDIGMFTLLNGKNVMFAHGHREKIATCVQDFEGATRKYIDYVCVGHYHCSKMKSFQNTKVFINGSIVGTEEYAYSHRLFSEPEQTLILFENNNVIVDYINLNIK